MTDKSEFLEKDVSEMKIVDLKRGIAVLGGKIPQGTTLKRQIQEIFVQCRQDYISRVGSQSANTATFNSQSPQRTYEAADDGLVATQAKQFNQPFAPAQQSAFPAQLPVVTNHSVAAEHPEQPDLTLNAFQITGANLLNEQIRTYLHRENQQFSADIQPLRPLRPPKGIERTPNYDDLESFIRPQSAVQKVQLDYLYTVVQQAGAQTVVYQANTMANRSYSHYPQSPQPSYLHQSQYVQASVSNFDFTTNFTQNYLTENALDSTVYIDERVRYFDSMNSSEAMQKTYTQIDTLHEQMRGLLANVGSPIKQNAVTRQVIVPAGQEIAESEGERVAKPKKNPRRPQKKQFKEREIAQAYKTAEKQVGPKQLPQQTNFNQEETKSELTPEDLQFHVNAKGHEFGSPEPRKQSFAADSSFKQQKLSRTSAWMLVLGSFMLLIVSTVIINAANRRYIVSVPLFTRAAQCLLSRVFPASVYAKSKTLALYYYTISGSQQSTLEAYTPCKEGYLQLTARDSSQIADFRLRLRGALVNVRNWILFDEKRYAATPDVKCVENATQAVVEFEASEEFKNALRKRITVHYAAHIRALRHQLNCYINAVCQIKRRRQATEVQIEPVELNVTDFFDGDSGASMFLRKAFDIYQSDSGSDIYCRILPYYLGVRPSWALKVRLQFALHPLVFACKILLFALTAIGFAYAVYRIALIVLVRKHYQRAVNFLRRYKQQNSHASARSAYILSALLNSRLPDFVIEEVLSNVEKLLQACDKIDTRYARNVFGEVEMEFLWVGGAWTERGATSFLDDEESTHTIEF